ncbi:hypothetical protein [Pantoea dispersa]|uniref:Uncharacterized protein n=1 Tax=Pantoea dispersa TaxID=59814 RepID=A0ABY3A027_9GAMM|nr:hypothetical protein [Pantoea dispersa]TQC75529.1 hypothetical protein FK492_06285 [Pantoea dispersa]
MSKFKVHFNLVRKMAGGGQGVASDSVTVEASSESSAIQVAMSKIQSKSAWNDYSPQVKKVEAL